MHIKRAIVSSHKVDELALKTPRKKINQLSYVQFLQFAFFFFFSAGSTNNFPVLIVARLVISWRGKQKPSWRRCQVQHASTVYCVVCMPTRHCKRSAAVGTSLCLRVVVFARSFQIPKVAHTAPSDSCTSKIPNTTECHVLGILHNSIPASGGTTNTELICPVPVIFFRWRFIYVWDATNTKSMGSC